MRHNEQWARPTVVRQPHTPDWLIGEWTVELPNESDETCRLQLIWSIYEIASQSDPYWDASAAEGGPSDNLETTVRVLRSASPGTCRGLTIEVRADYGDRRLIAVILDSKIHAVAVGSFSRTNM